MGKRNLRSATPKPKTHKRPPAPPPIDIGLPSPSIPPSFHDPKFFSTEIAPEIFSDGTHVPEIFFSQNSLENQEVI